MEERNFPPFSNFSKRFLTEWRKLKLPFENATFVAAVSGGADSVALLLVLEDLRKRGKLKNRFVVAHFDHNLREDSAKDAEFVKSLCIKFDFEFAPGRGNISTTGNTEQNARIARYAFLKQTAENLHAHSVLTAHTVNDQAETFLINLIRGSGVSGLGAMPTMRKLDEDKISEEEKDEFETNDQSQIADRKSQIHLVRPFLNWAKREDTESFCRLNEIAYAYDTMNEDLAFKRVRVRKILLPLLMDFNPKIVETLANTANLLREEVTANHETKDQKPNTEHQTLKLSDLKTLSKSALYRTLREWLEFNRGNLRGLELKHITAIERLIFSRRSGKTVEIGNGEVVVKEGGKLLFQKENIEKQIINE